MKEKVSVLIADDNQEFSHTLSTYINAQDDMQVVGIAATTAAYNNQEKQKQKYKGKYLSKRK